ncbi:Raf-like protein serine/threonine-protein kinase Raf [Frankliniella fusca]|uniref:Raf-like protein serine/threonine-protein kinase Raf n=1 Tax=Frankliniella fusca TaxID=407009 RepID=A0AAE1H235_9NEOP|nr:Raf-like protein serine/threonine-protein kinase Raf [Frankliniella fusca]
MSSSPSEEEDSLLAEIRNVRSVIQLTRENIDALNAKFADYPNPPQMYVNEYEELTGKLHELNNKEQELLDRRSHREEELLRQDGAFEDRSLSDPVGEGPTAQSMSMIKAYLPNQQRTVVHCRPGLTLREALNKGLSRRNLSPEMCTVVTVAQRIPLSWDTEITSIIGEEIRVEILEMFPVTSKDCCSRDSVAGLVGIDFTKDAHQNTETPAGILHMPTGYNNTGRVQQPVRRSNRSLGHGERSSSAPNVSYNLMVEVLSHSALMLMCKCGPLL